jgi:hypothetical protein
VATRDPAAAFGHRYVRTRRRVQLAAALAWVALPLSGLLRVDLPHLRILFAGHAWPPLTTAALPAEALARGAAPRWDILLPAIAGTVLPVLAFVVAFVLLARRFGRVHCGFTCVYGALAEHGERLFRWARAPGPGRAGRLALAWALVLAAAPAVAFVILAIFLGPAGVAAGVAAANPVVLAPFGVLTAIAAAMGGFVRLRFCRYVCGVGLIQTVSWVTNPKALEMGFNPVAAPDGSRGSMRDCTGCHGCRDVCPIGFDPRAPKRTMLACFQCGLCLERCEEELHPLGKGAAIGFHLADPDYPLAAHRGKMRPAATAAALMGKAGPG